MRLLLLALILYSKLVLAHQTSLTSDQKEIRWNTNTVPMRIINNSSSYPASNSMIEQALAEWNGVSSFNIQKVSSSNNLIQFSHDFSLYGSAVVGVTEVTYNSSGIISTAKILLNDQNYNFTNNPASAIGSSQIYLKDVVTHELGHFIGLTHSEVLNSSMFYSNFPGQSTLAADDRAGIRNKYDGGYGKIYGHVKGGNHVGVLGAHVQAVSRRSGETIGGVSDENGYFEIGGLDLNDSYYLYTSPLKNLNALPSHLANVQTDFCPSSYIGSFFSACGKENDGVPSAINLNSIHSEIDVGEVSINCVMRAQEDYIYQKIQNSFSEISIFNYSDEQRWEKAYVGFFLKSQLATWTNEDKFKIDLTGLPSPGSKKIKIRLISQVLGNAVEYSMIVKKGSSHISGSPFQFTTNSDNSLKLDLVAEDNLSGGSNVFHLQIKARKLDTWDSIYSIPDVLKFSSNKYLPYLLVISLEDTFTGMLQDTISDLSDNSSCLEAPFTYAVSKSTTAAEKDSPATSEAAAAASCGTLGPPPGPPGSGNFMLLMSLSFMLSLFLSSFVKRSKNFLS